MAFRNLFFLFVVIGAVSCHRDDDKAPYVCEATSSVIDTLTNATGTLLFDEKNNVFIIQSPLPNTIDQINIYVLCSPTLELPPSGQQVVFSGYTRFSSLKPDVYGEESYELELTSIK